MKTTTGIEGLDKFLKGGFDQDDVIMVNGLKSARDVYALQFIKKGIYLSTESVEDILERLSGLSIKSDIEFIAVQTSKKTKRTSYIESLASLEDMSMSIGDLIHKMKKPRLVINLLSSMTLYNEIERIVRFLQTTIDRCKEIGVPMVIVVDEEMHDKKEFETMKELCNVVVNFLRTESGDFVQVRNNCPASLLEFKIEKSGIVIKEQFL
jgi:KaiC/GvpD/RAD55 family RecA-like ATPase